MISKSKEINIKQGFTLVELLIVLAIISILAAAVYPAYTGQIRKSERKRVVAEMLSIAARMERIKTQQFKYPTPAPADIVSNDKLRYAVTVTSTDGVTFTIAADPSGFSAQASDMCGAMSLTEKGQWAFAGTLAEEDCL